MLAGNPTNTKMRLLTVILIMLALAAQAQQPARMNSLFSGSVLPNKGWSWPTGDIRLVCFLMLGGIFFSFFLIYRTRLGYAAIRRRLAQEQEKQQLLARQNEALERQVSERTSVLSQSQTELTAIQQQLIQKEKMASLGELTAGIAHEIQNPLNFVNNFSEISVELLGELKEEILAGHTDEVLIITNELGQNLQKISQHGGRASSIVRNILEHSRSGSGWKQPTNLNALADEYLKLAYQGLRTKDKDFNAQLTTQFDSHVDKVNLIPQEIGRVLLNLYNNAFYAVRQKQLKQGNGFQPQVSVSTHTDGYRVEVRVKDNGTGIPAEVVSKIYQPFFTTKPTGQGTGLGLSLSYDIITKGHRGELCVESREGEGTEFTVWLPISS